jgi:hypothetical protein
MHRLMLEAVQIDRKLQATYDVIVLTGVKKRGPCYSCDDRSLVVIDDGLMSAYGWACDNSL